MLSDNDIKKLFTHNKFNTESREIQSFKRNKNLIFEDEYDSLEINNFEKKEIINEKRNLKKVYGDNLWNSKGAKCNFLLDDNKNKQTPQTTTQSISNLKSLVNSRKIARDNSQNSDFLSTANLNYMEKQHIESCNSFDIYSNDYLQDLGNNLNSEKFDIEDKKGIIANTKKNSEIQKKLIKENIISKSGNKNIRLTIEKLNPKKNYNPEFHNEYDKDMENQANDKILEDQRIKNL